MSKTSEINRRVLVSLIQERGRGADGFSMGEIIEAYRDRRHNAIIDGQETIRGYVIGLTDFGILRRHGPDRYVVAD